MQTGRIVRVLICRSTPNEAAYEPRLWRLAQTSSCPEALHYANLAKTWLTLAGDLDDRNEMLKSEPDKKAG